MAVVSNSSPLILYARIGRLALLRQMFTEILIPPAVHREVVERGRARPGAPEVAVADWIRVMPLASDDLLRQLRREVDAGEAEVLALAVALGTGTVALLDDRRGRRVAERLGVAVAGCARVAVFLKGAGVISAVRPVLDDLRAAGLYLSESVYREALAVAHE